MDPEQRATRRMAGGDHVPASARSPERMRMAAYDGSPVDETDEDVDFIARLAREAEATLASPSDPPPVHPRRFTVPAADVLDVFREIRPERPRPRVLQTMDIAPVDMDDLLEQLSTTAAALRLRKAA
jgi:hypothetical protein